MNNRNWLTARTGKSPKKLDTTYF